MFSAFLFCKKERELTDGRLKNEIEELEKKLLKEVAHLEKQPFGSHEGSVLRNYLDVCLELPWNKRSKERVDITAARKILDQDHYGMEKVKKRILEYLAVCKRTGNSEGNILCLVGPPGVGKTSIAKSIAIFNSSFIKIQLLMRWKVDYSKYLHIQNYTCIDIQSLTNIAKI